MILVDFETRSRIDLKRYGTYLYASDVSTEILCAAFMSTHDNDEWLWRNPTIYRGVDEDANTMPFLLREAFDNETVLVAAHNAQFDRLIWEYIAEPDHKFPYVEYNRWYCTSAMCRVNALPGKLEDAIRAITSEISKDFRGAALIRQLSVPRDDGSFDEDPVALEEMAEYCLQDLRVTKRLTQECRPMTISEHRDWLICDDINERGVRVDVELARAAVDYASVEAAAIAQRLSLITNGRITKHTQTQRIRDYTLKNLEQADISNAPMVRYKNGEKKFSIDKSVRSELLGRAAELNLPANVEEVLQLTDDGNRSSVAKFQKMVDRADPEDERVRGAFVYAGAGQTIRYASRGLQLHNMRRDCWSDDEAIALRGRMLRGDDESSLSQGSIMNTLSRLLRPTLIPGRGLVFVVGDWSAIEAMGLPWLAGANHVLDIFKAHQADPENNPDVYVYTAEQLGIDDRQIGKVALLSLGYGGSMGALNAMARNYGVTIDPAVGERIIYRWRNMNEWAPEFWRRLEKAAIKAVQHPNEAYEVGAIHYVFLPNVLHGTLCCVLPGDIIIQYPAARYETIETQYGIRRGITALKASWKARADAPEWPRNALWHGLLAENVTQAFCAGILRHALHQLEDTDGPGETVMHVHDEIVLEVPEWEAYAAQTRLSNIMNTTPEWARGLPLKAEPRIAYRYGK